MEEVEGAGEVLPGSAPGCVNGLRVVRRIELLADEAAGAAPAGSEGCATPAISGETTRGAGAGIPARCGVPQ